MVSVFISNLQRPSRLSAAQTPRPASLQRYSWRSSAHLGRTAGKVPVHADAPTRWCSSTADDVLDGGPWACCGVRARPVGSVGDGHGRDASHADEGCSRGSGPERAKSGAKPFSLLNGRQQGGVQPVILDEPFIGRACSRDAGRGWEALGVLPG